MARTTPLCSRNARSQKTLVGRAQWGTHPSHPGKTYMNTIGRGIFSHSLRPCWTICLNSLRLVQSRWRFEVRDSRS
jgi:hypothetical protein